MSLTQKCKVEGCNNTNYIKRGYCSRHYQKFLHNGIINKVHNTNGLSQHPLAKTHQGMMSRCYNKGHVSYSYYGGRGIAVCEKWHNIENFISDVGIRPLGCTLDRIDVNGDYEPKNCRWSTLSQQRLNTRLDKRNKTGVTGVSWNRWKNKWQAYLQRTNLGYFNTIEEAVEARKKAESIKHKTPFRG